MLWTVGSLSIIVGLYLGGIYWHRAARANQNALVWGLGALLAFDVVIGVLLLLISLLGSALGLPYFMQVWIGCVLWFIVTLIAGIKTDSLFETKLRVAEA